MMQSKKHAKICDRKMNLDMARKDWILATELKDYIDIVGFKP